MLWSLGYSLSTVDTIGWTVFKGAKLYSSISLVQLVVETALKALQCPNPGSYGIAGPLPGAGKPTDACLYAYIKNFGSIPGQDISAITDNMAQFYLKNCEFTLDLTGKEMNAEQVGPLIRSFVKYQPDIDLVDLALWQ